MPSAHTDGIGDPGAYKGNVATCREVRQMPFVYSQQALDTIGNLLTPDRLNCYLAASKGNKLIAIHLYEYNTIVAECMHGTIQPLEIALRNSIHNILWTDLKDDRW